MYEKILVLDFGGQYNQLIARRVRDNNVYAEVLPYTTPLEKFAKRAIKASSLPGDPTACTRRSLRIMIQPF